MSEVNPYASPAASPLPPAERGGRLVLRFEVEEEEFLLRTIRKSLPSEGAEFVGAILLLSVITPTFVLGLLLAQLPLILVGYIGGAIVAFTAREVYLRRYSRRFLQGMHRQLGIVGGAHCEVQLTRTRLFLNVAGKRWGWPLRKLSIFRWRGFERKPPFLLMSIVAKGELVLPVTGFADFGDSTPEEFHREFRRRAAACVTRRNRRRWRSFLRRPRRRRAAVD